MISRCPDRKDYGKREKTFEGAVFAGVVNQDDSGSTPAPSESAGG
jgi:hypothetical protein